jgi:type IV secretion system protein VirB10
MLFRFASSLGFLSAAVLAAQEPAPVPAPVQDYTIAAGVKIPLNIINSISTKHSQEGDKIYLETAFPILSKGRIVIPVGSYVSGTVTEVKKPGRIKGRGEIYVRFDTLTLPNGVTRDFTSRMGNMDASSSGKLDRDEGKVVGEGNKAGDIQTIATTTAAGTSIGGIAGAIGSHTGTGMAIGAGAGAAVGIIAVLASRGPDAILAKGSTVEMILDRAVTFTEPELNFGNYQAPRMTGLPVAQTPDPPKSPLAVRK